MEMTLITTHIEFGSSKNYSFPIQKNTLLCTVPTCHTISNWTPIFQVFGQLISCHLVVPEDPSKCIADELEVVYYESRKRDLKIRLMNEGRCDERPKP